MIDISSELLKASSDLRHRIDPASSDLLNRVADEVEGRINWDPGNEEWASIFVGDQLAAHVYMQGPLVLARAEWAGQIRSRVGPVVPVVEVRDWDDPVFVASPESLTAAFSDDVLTVGLDLSGFAASDLWYHTI